MVHAASTLHRCLVTKGIVFGGFLIVKEVDKRRDVKVYYSSDNYSTASHLILYSILNNAIMRRNFKYPRNRGNE
jgi:hypothetical protein